MTIEANLQQIADTLKAIHTTLASGAAVATAAAAAETPAADTKPKATKPKAETPAADTKPKAEPQTTKAVDWKADVMPVLLEINKSTKPEHGRAGLLKVMSHFSLPDGSKVPDLEKLGKHAEVLAFAKGVLSGETAAADDDMGLGI